MSISKALRYGQCVTRGSHSFTCHPHTNHTCLYSSTSRRHRPLTGTGMARLNYNTVRNIKKCIKHRQVLANSVKVICMIIVCTRLCIPQRIVTHPISHVKELCLPFPQSLSQNCAQAGWERVRLNTPSWPWSTASDAASLSRMSSMLRIHPIYYRNKPRSQCFP